MSNSVTRNVSKVKVPSLTLWRPPAFREFWEKNA